MEKEIFRPIIGFEDKYEISNIGNVKSLNYRQTKNSNNLKPKISKQTGYKEVVLSNKKTKKTISIHKLVASAFIPNLDNKPCINHIDGNKLNNHVDNLEWCSYSENTVHSFKIGTQRPNYIILKNNGKLKRKKVLQFDKNMNFIKEWNSQTEVAKHFGIYPSCISEVCRGKRKSCKGFIWKLKEENYDIQGDKTTT